ncbi:MAG TPA: GNAT family N-acetyltransferase [Conexibacter sp.]|nr:GNAT family N-acetyltransferase [Conexibacter sp.]
MASPLDAELVADPDRLAELAPAWDALAVACGRPLCAPAWMLAWWRHLPAPGARLSVVAVHDGDELVGLAPFVAEPKRFGRTDLRLLGGAMPRTGPLALPGREWEAAEAVAGALSRARPRADVIALESGPVASHWPRALAERWPGALRPPLRRYYVQDSHVVSLAAGSFEQWMADKGSHFRKRMRKVRRDVEAAGGSARISTAQTVSADIAAFMRLHAARWEGRGESAIVVRERQLTAVYEEVAAAHLADGRFRLYLVELDGEPVAAELLAAAGGEVSSINGGWDEAHARIGVSNACMLHAIEDAFARGDRRLDWGPGDQLFKRRFADGNDPVCWTLLLVPRPRMPLTLARVAPTIVRVEGREALKRALPPERQERVRKLRARLLGRG